MPLLWVRSRLFAFVVVGTVFCCCSVVHGDVTVASGRQTQAQTIAVPSVHVNAGSVVDQEACYAALQDAMQQTDHHRNMTLEEYLHFAIAYRPDADGFFVEDEDTVIGEHQHDDDISITAAVEALLFDVQFLLVVHYYSPFYNYNRAADNDDRGVGSNKNTGSIETTRSLVGDTTPTVSEHSYLFQVCTTPTSNSTTLHNQSTDSLQSSTTIAPPSSTVVPHTETEEEAPTTTTTTTVPEDSVSAPSTTSTAVPTAAANGTTLVVPPPPTSMNREEQQGQSTNDNNNNSTTTTTTIITEEEDRRVARIVGPVVVVVIIAVMIIAYYVTQQRRRSKNEEDEEENDAAVAVLLLQPPQVAAAAIAHNTTTSDDDDDLEDKNVVVIVDTAIKITDVSNDNVMTNQLSLKLVQQEGGGGGGVGGGGTEHYSWSSSCPSVMSSSGWSSSAGVDSP